MDFSTIIYYESNHQYCTAKTTTYTYAGKRGTFLLVVVVVVVVVVVGIVFMI